jgi:hypothetical protein
MTKTLVQFFQDDDDRVLLMISNLLTIANAELAKSPELGGPFS